jgi:hypothetical protein
MDDKVPNPQFDKEQAEGERETVEEALSHERQQQKQGLSNRSVEADAGEQA